MSLDAWRCPNGHLMYPRHPRCRDCGGEPTEVVDLTDSVAEILTWTVSYATPPGVREPNPLAIVRFEIDGESVTALGGLTTDEVATGDRVRPVPVEELRDPHAGIRHIDSQSWDGYRFEPVD